MLRAKKKRLQIECVKCLIEPMTRVADIQRTFHQLDHYLPMCNHAEKSGTVLNRFSDARRQNVGRTHRQQRHARIQQVAFQNSPERSLSMSIGSSQPGLRWICPRMVSNRTFRRVGGGGTSCATGLPLRVITTCSPSATERSNAERLFLASATETSISLI